jgi:hypothetical protein
MMATRQSERRRRVASARNKDWPSSSGTGWFCRLHEGLSPALRRRSPAARFGGAGGATRRGTKFFVSLRRSARATTCWSASWSRASSRTFIGDSGQRWSSSRRGIGGNTWPRSGMSTPGPALTAPARRPSRSGSRLRSCRRLNACRRRRRRRSFRLGRSWVANQREWVAESRRLERDDRC